MFAMVSNRETEEVVKEGEKTVVSDKPLTEEESKDEKGENAVTETEEKEPEDKVKCKVKLWKSALEGETLQDQPKMF